jgi:nicotinamidase-related amidase
MPRPLTTALVVVDMLNTYDHPDADVLAESVRGVLGNIEELIRRARASDDTLLFYANDNHERWELSREQLVEQAKAGEHPELIGPIAPQGDEPFIMKGRHSIFYQSSVDHLIQVAGVEQLILCGQVTEQCIQYSALDAYMRGFEVDVPRDAVAHINPEWAEATFGMMEKNMHADLTSVADGVLA